MATLSQYLFVVGALLLLFAFVLSVGYTTLLAVGRRATAAVTAGVPRLAAAGPGQAAPVLTAAPTPLQLSLIHISEPTRHDTRSRMPSSA